MIPEDFLELIKQAPIKQKLMNNLKTRQWSLERAKKGARVVTDQMLDVKILSFTPFIIAMRFPSGHWQILERFDKNTGKHQAHSFCLKLIDEPVEGDIVHVKNSFDKQWKKAEYFTQTKNYYCVLGDPIKRSIGREIYFYDNCKEFEELEESEFDGKDDYIKSDSLNKTDLFNFIEELQKLINKYKD